MFEKFCFLTLCVLGIYFIHSSLTTFIADSEMWAVSLSKCLYPWVEGQGHSVLMKLSFYAPLRLVYLFSNDDFTLFLIARVLYGTIGLAIVVLTWFITFEVFKCKTTAYISSFLLLSSSFFYVHGFRIRSDLLASFLSLFLIYVVLIKLREGSKARFFDVLKIFCILILLAFSTPKSVYFFVSLSGFIYLFYKSLGLHIVDKLFRKSRRKKLVFGTFFLLISTGFYFSHRIVKDAFSFIFLDAVNYISITFHPKPGVQPYMSRESFVFIEYFIEQNPFFSLLIILGFFYSFFNLFSWKKNHRAFSCLEALSFFNILQFCALIFHTEKFPFFISSLLPALSIQAGMVFSSILKVARNDRTKEVLAFIVVVFLIFNTVRRHERMYEIFNNFFQRDAVNTLKNYFKNFGDVKIYDGIGIFPTTNTIFSLPDVATAEIKYDILETIIAKSRPDFVLYVRKMAIWEPALSRWFDQSYIDLGKGVWLRAEFKIPISQIQEYLKKVKKPDESDPYFYISSSDILTLLKSKKLLNYFDQELIFIAEDEDAKAQPVSLVLYDFNSEKGKEVEVLPSFLTVSIKELCFSFMYIKVRKDARNIAFLRLPAIEPQIERPVRDVFRYDYRFDF